MAKRYSASKIARTPSLKRKIAELLAENDMNTKPPMSLHNMLAYGHRGYISYDETSLMKLFDKAYKAKLEDAENRRKEIAQQPVNSRRTWEVDQQQKALKEIEDGLVKFREIADELFEATFL